MSKQEIYQKQGDAWVKVGGTDAPSVSFSEIQGNATDNTSLNTELDKKLNLTGGTLTGDLNLSENNKVVFNTGAISNTDTSDTLAIVGGTSTNDGSFLILGGEDSVANGDFRIGAAKGEWLSVLRGTCNGGAYNLTWNGKRIIDASKVHNDLTTTATEEPLSANQGKVLDEKKLDLAGGTMTGTIITSIDQALVKNNDSGALAIQGGSADSKGARLSLSGKDRTGGYAGMFTLRAYDGTNDKTLTGKPDGTLTWGSNDISGTPTQYTISTGSGTNISVYRSYCYKVGRMVFVSIAGKNNTEIAEYTTSVPIFTGLPAPIAKWDLGVHYFDRSTVRGTRFQLDTNGRIMSDSEGFEANFFSFNFTYISAS